MNNDASQSPAFEELMEHCYLRQVENLVSSLDDVDDELISQACRNGFLDGVERDSLRLTAKGLVAGRDVVRRHRLAECLLHDVLQFNPERIHSSACRLEHTLQFGLDEKICILLGHPHLSPHGHPIPEGACCRVARDLRLREVSALCDAKINQAGRVAYLRAGDDSEVQKLMAMGVLPGVAIVLLRRHPSYVFQIDYSKFSVDRKLAEAIFVHWSITGG